MEIKFKKTDKKAQIPVQSYDGDVGWDVVATKNYLIRPFETKLIGTGVSVDIPIGYEIQIRSRSGMALKQSLFVLNSPATIDQNFKGEIGVILHNLKPFSQYIKEGDRVAQFVVKKTEPVTWTEVEELSDSERGIKGFGSSD